MLVMHTHEGRCTLKTADRFDFVDITDDVQDVVRSSGVAGGRVTVFSPSDRCPIVVNERESGLLEDIKRALDRVGRGEEGAALSTIGSKSVVLPVVGGKVRLGTWQRLLLFELEGSHERSVVVQVVGE